MTKVIYDIGSNNGDDIPYYLQKADLVVAVEANPVLCQQIRNRFSAEVAENRLAIENIVVSNHDDHEVDFWIHETDDVLSTMNQPCKDLTSYKLVRLPSKSIHNLIKQYGSPWYVKIDIEGADELIVRQMFEIGVYPPFLSVEADSVQVLGVLLSLGNYRHFKLVDGASVHTRYTNAVISDKLNQRRSYTFPYHSAGPFGDDIDGEWMLPDVFTRYFALAGAGWKDIHVTNLPIDRVGDNYTELQDIHGVASKWLVKVAMRRILNYVSWRFVSHFQKP